MEDGALTVIPSVQVTVLPLHSEPEPTPMTLTGLQSRPRMTFASCTLMPNALSKAAPATELAWSQSVGLNIPLIDQINDDAHGFHAGAARKPMAC